MCGWVRKTITQAAPHTAAVEQVCQTTWTQFPPKEKHRSAQKQFLSSEGVKTHCAKVAPRRAQSSPRGGPWAPISFYSTRDYTIRLFTPRLNM